MARNVLEALERALNGDLTAMGEIATAEHASLREAEEAIGRPLRLTRAATARIVRGLIDDPRSPAAAQAWASLMRRGYVQGSADRGPIAPIDVEFEEAWEDAISAAVSRLDEIGDAVDGEVAVGEALDLLQLLGEP